MTARPRRRPRKISDGVIKKLQQALPGFEDWSDLASRRTRLTRKNAVAPLADFVKEGGSLIGIGRSSRSLIEIFDLPFRTGIRVAASSKDSGKGKNDGTDKNDDTGKKTAKKTAKKGALRPANRAEFFIPGSLIRLRYDQHSFLGAGKTAKHNEEVAMFRRSLVFSWKGKPKPGITTPILYADKDQLASGWAIGQELLAGKAAAIHARKGKGHVFAFGPDMLYRGQSWSSFQPVFRAILVGSSEAVRAPR